MDSLINGNIRELEDFCDRVIGTGLDKWGKTIWWGANACVRKEMTSEILVKMEKAGCRFLNFGFESGSENVLKMMNKRFDIQTAENVFRDTTNAGIDVNLYMLIGFPTETEEDFKETLQFFSKNRDHIHYAYAGAGCTINPNSDLNINPEKYGIYWKNEPGVEKDGRNWYSETTSPQIRIDRVRRFVDHCKEIGVNSENLLDKLTINVKI